VIDEGGNVIGHLTADPVPDEVANAFGRLIRHHRTRIGLTQRELADFSTVSERAIRDLEHGRATRPRNDTVRLIADGLRLGPRARAALESAAYQGRVGSPLKADYDARPPGPPNASDPLFGCEPQIRMLAVELSAGFERIVHIVGLGGVGKTRIALEVAARVHTGEGIPVLWSALRDAPVDRGPDDGAESLGSMVRRCADGLFPRSPAGPDGTAAVAELAALVDDRPALLVLDGADERLPRAGALADLLHQCPRLRLLVTSTAPFDVPQERVFLLEPLAVADPARPAHDGDGPRPEQAPSTALLLHHIRRVRPGFAPEPDEFGTLARICRLLDGLPAALRAAASWMLIYDLETLHACLADSPDSLLGHLTGTVGDCVLPDALARARLRLREPVDDLLAALCERGDRGDRGERDGGFGLADVMALTGANLSDSGRMVRELLLVGAVRTLHTGGQARFSVLNLVRVSRAHGLLGAGPGPEVRGTGEAAALLPGQPPITAGARK
jgi:transcriptional regulator with XRE-family HTH domain